MAKESKIDKVLNELIGIRKEIFGNGKIGLCERVRNAERKICEIQSFPKKIPGGLAILLNIIWTGILIYMFFHQQHSGHPMVKP